MRVDHILVFVGNDGSEIRELEQFGLISGRRATHPGQGTTNTCFAFDNVFIELVWKTNDLEITSARTRRLALAERTSWWKSRACPFGCAMQLTQDDEAPLPFDTWPYTPQYLPENSGPILMNVNSNDMKLPLTFFVPEYEPDPAHRQQVNLGMHKVTSCNLVLPTGLEASCRLTQQLANTYVTVSYGNDYHMELEIDQGHAQCNHSFNHPNLPVELKW